MDNRCKYRKVNISKNSQHFHCDFHTSLEFLTCCLFRPFNTLSRNFYGPPPHRGPPRNPAEACAHFTVISCGILQRTRSAASLKSTTSRQRSEGNRERRIFALLTLQAYYSSRFSLVFSTLRSRVIRRSNQTAALNRFSTFPRMP